MQLLSKTEETGAPIKVKYKLYRDDKLKHISYETNVHSNEIELKSISINDMISKSVMWYKAHAFYANKLLVYVNNELVKQIEFKR